MVKKNVDRGRFFGPASRRYGKEDEENENSWKETAEPMYTSIGSAV